MGRQQEGAAVQMTNQQSVPSLQLNQVPLQQELCPAFHLEADQVRPRFLDGEFENEEKIVQKLYDEVDVDELIQSILSAGYLDLNPWS